MCQKIIKGSVLSEKKWDDICIDSVIVSFCNDCGCQRIHSCVDVFSSNGEIMYVFVCDFCRFNSGDMF